ncbi:phage holin family protein [Oscillospiraceae bacterium PP1C4]
MTFQDFIKPELIVLVPVLYIVGIALKASCIDNCHIPMLLGIAGISLASLWVIATTQLFTIQHIAMGLFSAVTQGILVAGASVYYDQLIKQSKK